MTKAIATFEFEDETLMHDFLAHMSDGGGEYQYMESVEMRFKRDEKLRAEKSEFVDIICRDGPKARSVDFDYHTANGGKFGPVVRVTWLKEDEEEPDAVP